MKLYNHPDYDIQVEDWIQYRTFFTGEGVNASFLIKHEFEEGTGDVSERLWANRFKRTEYTNLVDPYINRYCSMVFSGENDFSIVAEKLGDTAYNVDGDGLSFEDFLRREVAKDLVLYGKPTVFITSPEGERVRPYLKTISPINIKSWKHDNGELIAIRYDYDFIDVGDLLTKPETKKYSDIYMLEGSNVLVTQYEKQSADNDYKLIDEKVIQGLDLFPFVQVISDTRMKKCTPILRAKHNLESAYDNQLLYQAIQRIIILGENISSDAPVVASEGAITVLKGTNASIEVIEPTEPKSLERRIEQRLNDFFKIAFNQTRHMPTDSRVGQSADTLREGKEDFVKQVENTAKDLQIIANKTFERMCKIQGVEYNPEEDKILIGKNLNPENLQEQVQTARLFFDEINKYPTWRKEYLKKLARSFNLNEIEQIEKEIESGTVTETTRNRLQEFINGGSQETA